VPAARTLLVLGAGASQLGLLEAARERGDLRVLAADRDPQAPGFALADERAVISSEDEPALERLARAREVDGIVSPGADWPVGIAARIAERLGLPHPIDAATAAVATSKARQRERFAAAGIPCPRSFDPGAPDLPFPCVVKAPDRQGQRGLTLVGAASELEQALAEAAQEARYGQVLVEELAEGPEITVNGIWENGSPVVLTVTDRVLAEPPAFGVALAHVWPSLHATDEAVAVATEAARAVGIANGPSYVQVRITASGPSVMEVAARLGGGHDAELCRAALAVDLNALAVAFALGEPPREMPGASSTGHGSGGACVRFLVAPPGRLVAVHGLAEAEAVPGVEWVRSYRRPGWELGPLRRGADRAGATLAVGATREEALERADRAAQAVRFEVDADAP
jgi:biotin carboxylase